MWYVSRCRAQLQRVGAGSSELRQTKSGESAASSAALLERFLPAEFLCVAGLGSPPRTPPPLPLLYSTLWTTRSIHSLWVISHPHCWLRLTFNININMFIVFTLNSLIFMCPKFFVLLTQKSYSNIAHTHSFSRSFTHLNIIALVPSKSANQRVVQLNAMSSYVP